MTARNTLGAGARLKREKDLETLFRTGKAFSAFPLKAIWLLTTPRAGEEAMPVKAAFSAPKKRFRKAVQRNRVKRLMREAWRLQKKVLEAAVPEAQQFHVFLIFTGPELPDFGTVHAATAKVLARLVKELPQPGAAGSNSLPDNTTAAS